MRIHDGLGWIVLSGCLALAGAACGGDDGGGGKGGSGGTGGSGAVGGAGGTGGTAGTGGSGGTGGTGGTGGEQQTFTLRIADFTYSPDRLVVPPGGTVVVENADTMPHSVTSGSCSGTNCIESDVNGIGFDTAIIPAGETASFTIAADAVAGTEVPYFCVVHPGMGAPPAGMRNLGTIVIGQ